MLPELEGLVPAGDAKPNVFAFGVGGTTPMTAAALVGGTAVAIASPLSTSALPPVLILFGTAGRAALLAADGEGCC